MSHQQKRFVTWSALALMGVAGAWTLFHLIWNIAAQTSDDQWGIALLILFVLALLLAFVQFFQERATLKAITSAERFPEPAIAKFFLASEGSAAMWFVVRMEVGAEWVLAGWEKMQSPAWGTSGKALSGFVAGALAKAVEDGFVASTEVEEWLEEQAALEASGDFFQMWLYVMAIGTV